MSVLFQGTFLPPVAVKVFPSFGIAFGRLRAALSSQSVTDNIAWGGFQAIPDVISLRTGSETREGEKSPFSIFPREDTRAHECFL
jgi:hypothetical protein